MPPVNLEATVARYNSFVDSGTDADFAKPTPRYRIDTPPFYAAWATPVVHDTRAGLRINAACEVVDINGAVIPGLYCGGESAGGFSQHGLAARPRRGFRPGSPRGDVYRRLGLPDGLINIIAALIGAGVLERHPRLKVSFGESGIGWLPYALDRMEFEYEDRFRDLMKLKPSEYWRRQCKATFQFDPIGTKLVDDIGVETLMWGSDYPHTDGIWPESTKYIEEQFAGLAPEVVHKITCENAAKFYNLIN
jgi:hypothetical protein